MNCKVIELFKKYIPNIIVFPKCILKLTEQTKNKKKCELNV